ncbi:hypothetical protein [Gimesia algae]|uniref:Uncharacterized protein n=1 Tax=Gimesia algae TaxID=2527971 RepID=A0A517VI88_9PLAN|nr:hypothetical protein [Gimesia algae]QDT92721.1 hypothetical protein Pan161_43910 [Gimesia algae]
MKNRFANYFTVTLCVVGLTLVGCDSGIEQGTKSFDEAAPEDVTMEDQDHGHDHPSEGPHHGSLIELGKEAYHAELVHDEKSGAITIYILDGAAKASVPSTAESVQVNVKHDGKGQQFTLAAAPEQGDPEGKSSKFTTQDKTLGELLDEKDTTARLVLEIDGKSFTGEIDAHDHDHDHGHDEKHAH